MTEHATEQEPCEELKRLLQQLRTLKDELEKYKILLPPDELDRLTTKEKR
jgi:hypothetical protein